MVNANTSPATTAPALSDAEKTELMKQFDYLLKSGGLPKHVNSAPKLFMAYKLLTPLGLDWAINLRNTWQNPATQAFELCNDAPLAACQKRRDEYVGTVEYHVNAKGERRTQHNFIGFVVAGAVCVAKRKGKEDCIGLFTMEQAKQAQLMTKDNWRKYPEAMLTKRARAIALRQQWSDVLQGVGIHEADEFVAPAEERTAARVVHAMLGPSRHDAEPEVLPTADPPQAPPDAQDDRQVTFALDDDCGEAGLNG